MASSKGSRGTAKADRPPVKKPPPRPAERAKRPSAPAAPPDPPKPDGPWVIVQLSSTGEREKDIPTIVRAVHRILGKTLDVFVPAISQKVRDESQTLFYMDGYVFIRHTEGVNYGKLQDTMYFGPVLTQPAPGGSRSKAYALLPDRELAPMRVGMDQMKVGGFAEHDRVKVIQGNFKNLQAVVSYVHDGDQVVSVYVDMRSKKVLMDFPSSYLKIMEPL